MDIDTWLIRWVSTSSTQLNNNNQQQLHNFQLHNYNVQLQNLSRTLTIASSPWVKPNYITMTDGFITESNDFLAKLVYSEDRLKTLDETFNKKSDIKGSYYLFYQPIHPSANPIDIPLWFWNPDERQNFYRLLTLQTKHGYSAKKEAKALAAQVDNARRMNGNKKEGWAKHSERVSNLLLRQQLIDFKSTTAPNKKKTMTELKTLLHKNLTTDIIPPEDDEEKQAKYGSTLDKKLVTSQLLKKKWDQLNSKKGADNNVKKLE